MRILFKDIKTNKYQGVHVIMLHVRCFNTVLHDTDMIKADRLQYNKSFFYSIGRKTYNNFVFFVLNCQISMQKT